MHRLFLLINAQSFHNHQMEFTFDGTTLFFHFEPGEKRWILSTKVAHLRDGRGALFNEYFLNQSKAIFFSRDSFLEVDYLDGYGLYLKRYVKRFDMYIVFSEMLKEYLKEKTDWQEIFSISTFSSRGQTNAFSLL